MTVTKKRSRRKKYEQHVRLHHWVMNTAAYRSLGPADRVVLVELMARYTGSNNGRLFLSVRDAGKACLISKNTAARAFRALEERGFIRKIRASGFSVKCRRATEWALTEHYNDVTKTAPTKDFIRWRREGETTVPSQGPKSLVPSEATQTVLSSRL